MRDYGQANPRKEGGMLLFMGMSMKPLFSSC